MFLHYTNFVDRGAESNLTTNSVKNCRLTFFCSFHRQGLGQEFRQTENQIEVGQQKPTCLESVVNTRIIQKCLAPIHPRTSRPTPYDDQAT
jgi:hypothetical protein